MGLVYVQFTNPYQALGAEPIAVVFRAPFASHNVPTPFGLAQLVQL